tara:strand:+ start:2542 stop:2703 length:162 start_codon:yes stop_codon:yes gene_type:complete
MFMWLLENILHRHKFLIKLVLKNNYQLAPRTMSFCICTEGDIALAPSALTAAL